MAARVSVTMTAHKLSMKLIVYNVVLCLKSDFKMRIDVSKEGKRMMKPAVVAWEADNATRSTFK